MPLEELAPADVAMLLPQWRRAKPHYFSALLNVPNLDPTVQAEAFTAWLRSNVHFVPIQPIPFALVQAAPPEYLPRLLRVIFHRQLHVTPPPSAHQIDNLLFVLALSHPEVTHDFQVMATLAAWRDELRALSEDPETHTATDEEATWLALTVADLTYCDENLLLELLACFRQWPRHRQQALAPIILRTDILFVERLRLRAR